MTNSMAFKRPTSLSSASFFMAVALPWKLRDFHFRKVSTATFCNGGAA